ncbi:hypothetical protein [Nocardia lasii]|uniref:ESX-1 secretion-associated protein n=1 Tax=Nocardia lasii TaxID=1616107 RepID=A0ABW1K1R0_9NOCA
MGDLIQADLDALRLLAGKPTTEAAGIDTITPPIWAGLEAIVMPGADLEGLIGNIKTKLGTNLAEHATNVRNLSTGAATAANTYEDADATFKAQLDSLTGGIE